MSETDSKEETAAQGFATDVQKLQSLLGQKIASSDWVLMDQKRFDLFAAATDDPDPLHIDPDWCARFSPYGCTVAFGFLTMSMLTELHVRALGRSRGLQAQSGGYGLNYGFDRMRLIAPVRVNSRIRGHFTLLSLVERKPGEYLGRTKVEVEIEGSSRPALVGEWLSILVRDEGHDRIKEQAREQNASS